MRKTRLITVALGALLLAGCGNKSSLETIQEKAKADDQISVAEIARVLDERIESALADAKAKRWSECAAKLSECGFDDGGSLAYYTRVTEILGGAEPSQAALMELEKDQLADLVMAAHGWPSTTCAQGSVDAMLNQIISWASEDEMMGIPPLCEACRSHPVGDRSAHCGHLEAAYAHAQAAHAATDPGVKQSKWQLSATELGHGTSGG